MIATLVTDKNENYEVLLETDRVLMIDKSKFYAWVMESDVLDRDRKISLDEWLEEWDELDEVMTEYLQQAQKRENVIWAVS